MPTNLYQAIWIFMLYAFLGWCAEVAFAALEKGKFVNRGFLNGPVCPIYGFGMLAVVLCLWRFKRKLILLFLFSALLTTLLEFITGFILEKFFNDKWWDYSDKPFNIKGYICLEFTVLWGLAAAFAVGAVHPFVYAVIRKTPKTVGIMLLSVCLIAFTSDLILTVTELAKLPKRLNALLEAEMALKAVSDRIGENISEATIAAKEKGSELAEEKKPKLDELKAEYEKRRDELKALLGKRSPVHMRIFTAFPRLREGRYKSVFERIQELKSRAAERKKDEKD